MSGIGIGICSSGCSSSGAVGSLATGDWCARMSRLEGSLGSSGWEPAQAPLPSLPHLGVPSSAGAAAGSGGSPLARSPPAGPGSRRSHSPVATAWRQLSTEAGSGVSPLCRVSAAEVDGILLPTRSLRSLTGGLRFLLGDHWCATPSHADSIRGSRSQCASSLLGGPALVCDATVPGRPHWCASSLLCGAPGSVRHHCGLSCWQGCPKTLWVVCHHYCLHRCLQTVRRTGDTGGRRDYWRPGGSPGGAA